VENFPFPVHFHFILSWQFTNWKENTLFTNSNQLSNRIGGSHLLKLICPFFYRIAYHLVAKGKEQETTRRNTYLFNSSNRHQRSPATTCSFAALPHLNLQEGFAREHQNSPVTNRNVKCECMIHIYRPNALVTSTYFGRSSQILSRCPPFSNRLVLS
jgi:hypothetical protein